MQLNLILGFVWLLMAVPLLVVNGVGRPMFGLSPSRDSLIVAVLAMLLAGYNFVRWWATRTMRRRNRPEPPPRRRGPTIEYNPEFDFNRPGPKTLRSDEQ